LITTIAPYFGAFFLLTLAFFKMSLSFTIAALIALITLPVIVLLWATESEQQRRNRKQQRAVRLRGRGYSFRRIAESIGMSETTARNYCKVCAA